MVYGLHVPELVGWAQPGPHLVSEPDPSAGEEERVWAHAYIRVVLTECNYAR